MSDQNLHSGIAESNTRTAFPERLLRFQPPAARNGAAEESAVDQVGRKMRGACGKTVPDLSDCPLSGVCHTEAKRYAEELMRYAQELARSNEYLEQFAFIASHDLQEPLHKITNYAHLLRLRTHHQLDADSQRYIESIVEVANRMRNLVHDLLAYSKLSREKPAMEWVDLEVILDKTLFDLDPLIQRTTPPMNVPVPSVTISESIPKNRTMAPFRLPTRKPVPSAARQARPTGQS